MTDIQDFWRDYHRAISNPAPLGDGGTTSAEYEDLLERAADLLNETMLELEARTAHLKRLQHISIVILEDWWPLVHDRTCRQTVKAQGAMLRDAISND